MFSLIALGWLFLYLGFAGIQKTRVQNAATKFISNSESELIIKPTIGNQILWSVRYIEEDQVCTMGVRVGFSSPEVLEGECYPLLDWQQEFESYQETVLFNDIQRFSQLSEGYLVEHPDYPNVIGDARYSMLPTAILPLWGITIDTTKTDQHVSFDSYRDTSEETRQAFISMLLGNYD